MAAATQNIEIRREYIRNKRVYPVAATTTIYQGTLVMLVKGTGYLVPAAKTTGGVVVGVALEKVDNSGGSDGDLDCEVGVGVFRFPDNANAFAQAEIPQFVYVADDNNVADFGEGSQVVVGRALKLESGEVWVEVGMDGGALAELISALETVTSGAISVLTKSSKVSVTSTVAYTLADGLYEGQQKTLVCSVAASTPDGTVTPATFADGTSITLDAVGEFIVLEWHDTGGWHAIAYSGATINA